MQRSIGKSSDLEIIETLKKEAVARAHHVLRHPLTCDQPVKAPPTLTPCLPKHTHILPLPLPYPLSKHIRLGYLLFGP